MTLVLGAMPMAAGAHGFGLPVAGFAAGGTGLTTFYVLGFELGPWQEYLARELTPEYLVPSDADPVRISWLRYEDVRLLPDFAGDLEPRPETRLFMNHEWQGSFDYLAPSTEPDSMLQGTLFERQFFAPGFDHSVNDNGVLGVAAVIAYQRFSAANLGLLNATTPDAFDWANPGYSPYQESGYGTGVRLALRQEVTSRIAVETGFQSRIDMEEFAAYRGVYSNPADLDIPARAHVGFGLRASDRSWLNVAVERVLYSDINAFPSRYLPNRFLSLLGDSTSPEFGWEDLTVYSVGWAWTDGSDEQWHIDFSSRSQPAPSSRLLERVLAGELADSAVTVGYSRSTGRNSRLSLNAAYAPAEYAFGGSVLGVTTDDLDQRFEVEAFWTLRY